MGLFASLASQVITWKIIYAISAKSQIVSFVQLQMFVINANQDFIFQQLCYVILALILVHHANHKTEFPNAQPVLMAMSFIKMISPNALIFVEICWPSKTAITKKESLLMDVPMIVQLWKILLVKLIIIIKVPVRITVSLA